VDLGDFRGMVYGYDEENSVQCVKCFENLNLPSSLDFKCDTMLISVGTCHQSVGKGSDKADISWTYVSDFI